MESFRTTGLSLRASINPKALAIVPPDTPPRIEATRIFTFGRKLANLLLDSCCKKYTPKSDGIESKAQKLTILAPVLWATRSYLKSISFIQCVSPVISQ